VDTRSQLKTFFGKELCVYCSNLAQSKDHTPPRCFLRHPVGSDAKIITVPACKKCNGSFSKDEAVVKATLAHVSFEADLMADVKPAGSVYRAMERDSRLKSTIERCFQANGYFQPNTEILTCMDRILRKTVQGLYFATYGDFVTKENVQILEVTHTKQESAESLVAHFRRSSTPDFSVGIWPEVRPRPRRLEKAVRSAVLGSGCENDLMRPVEWIDVQKDAFRFTFFRGEADRAICVLEVRRTIAAAALCPWPSKRGPIRRGRNNPLAR